MPFMSPEPKLAIKSLQYEGFLVAQTVKCLPAMRETWIQFLGWEDPLEEAIATHSSILSWRISMYRSAFLNHLEHLEVHSTRSAKAWLGEF